MSYLLVACQAAIAVTFAISTGSKVRSRWAFADFEYSLPTMTGIPRWAAAPTAATVVAAEATVVLVLIAAAGSGLPGVAIGGWTLSVLLLIAFTAALAAMIYRGVDQPCRCFGRADRPPGAVELTRSGLLLAIAASGAAITLLRAPGPPEWQAHSLLAVMSGVVTALLLVNLDELVALTKAVPSGERCTESA